jgi:hypothetical protein
VTRSSFAFRAQVGGLVAHGAELPHHDHLVVEPVPALAEEDRSRGVELHRDRGEGEHGSAEQEHRDPDEEVLHPLADRLALRVDRPAQRGEGRVGEMGDGGDARRLVLLVDHQRDRVRERREPVHDLAHPGRRRGVDRHDDQVDVRHDAVGQQGFGVTEHGHPEDVQG